MFKSTFVGVGDDSHKPLSFLVSVLSQSLFVCLLVLVPLLTSPELPARNMVSFLLSPPPPPPPAPPSMPKAAAVAAPTEVFDDRLIAPVKMPDQAREIVDPREFEGGVGLSDAIGSPAGVEGGVLASIFSRTYSTPPPEPKPLPKVAKRVPRPARPVRIHSRIQAAKLLRRIAPRYPEIARVARIEGVVKIDAVIATDGTMQSIKVVSGNPFLVKAAVDAVRQWRYAPTVLNGSPVEVATRIVVNFKLQ